MSAQVAPAKSGAFTQQCKSQSHSNEDRFHIVDPISEDRKERFFAVYDGHGGDRCSEFLRQNMHERITSSKAFGVDYEESLKQGILSVEQQYHSVVDADETTDVLTEGTSGSCAVVALIVDRTLYVANVGDCRAVVSISGEAKALTRDHKATDPDEKERVVKAGGFVRSKRVFGLLAVTRSLGDFEYKLNDTSGTVIATPETFTEQLTDEHQVLILACDGVWDVLSNGVAVDFVLEALEKGQDGQEAAQGLAELAIERGSNDDVTVVVIPMTPSTRTHSTDTNSAPADAPE